MLFDVIGLDLLLVVTQIQLLLESGIPVLAAEEPDGVSQRVATILLAVLPTAYFVEALLEGLELSRMLCLLVLTGLQFLVNR